MLSANEKLKNNSLTLSVIMPAFNEEPLIEQNIEHLLNSLNDFHPSWELILVNDGSTDETHQALKNCQKKDDRIKVVSYPNNRGRGHALRTGFQHSKGTFVITTESDLSWGNQIISELLLELKASNADIVIASVYKKGGGFENVPWERAFLSWLGNQILRLTITPPITQLTGMTRGYKGDVIRSMELEEDGKEIHLEIISKACMLGLSFSEIPATLSWEKDRAKQSKTSNPFKLGKLVVSHLLFSVFESPILLFGSIGFLMLSAGLLLGIDLFIQFAFQGKTVGDHIVLIITTMFLNLSGLQIFLFCFLAYQNKMLRKECYRNFQKNRLFFQAQLKENIFSHE